MVLKRPREPEEYGDGGGIGIGAIALIAVLSMMVILIVPYTLLGTATRIEERAQAPEVEFIIAETYLATTSGLFGDTDRHCIAVQADGQGEGRMDIPSCANIEGDLVTAKYYGESWHLVEEEEESEQK